MSYIQTYEDEIVQALQYAFGEKQPYITADMNYGDAGDEKKVMDKAKLYANSKNNGATIFVGYTGKNFGDGIGTGGVKIYKPFYQFAIMMYALNRRKSGTSHLDIYDVIETVEETLWERGYQLYQDDNIPVKIDETGLYRSVLLIGIYKPFKVTQ